MSLLKNSLVAEVTTVSFNGCVIFPPVFWWQALRTPASCISPVSLQNHWEEAEPKEQAMVKLGLRHGLRKDNSSACSREHFWNIILRS